MHVQTAHTSDLATATLHAARALLDSAFAGEMTDDDWEHTLGGMHALGWLDGELVAHGAVIQRRLLHGGRALRTGYVEAVAVQIDHQRRGYGTLVMQALESVIRRAYVVGALGTSDQAPRFYEALGWRRWDGPTAALTPNGVRRTPEEDGWIYVLPVACELDFAGELACDYRDGGEW